jgi:hypothetical protein
VRSEDKYQLGLEYQRRAFAEALPGPVKKEKLAEFIAALGILKSLGSKVYLVRYPISPEVAELPRMSDWIASVEKHFKAPHYQWINVPADSDFVTTDGLHIDSAGALRMAQILKSSIGE